MSDFFVADEVIIVRMAGALRGRNLDDEGSRVFGYATAGVRRADLRACSWPVADATAQRYELARRKLYPVAADG